jgi:hypothetical protein
MRCWKARCFCLRRSSGLASLRARGGGRGSGGCAAPPGAAAAAAASAQGARAPGARAAPVDARLVDLVRAAEAALELQVGGERLVEERVVLADALVLRGAQQQRLVGRLAAPGQLRACWRRPAQRRPVGPPLGAAAHLEEQEDVAGVRQAVGLQRGGGQGRGRRRCAGARSRLRGGGGAPIGGLRIGSRAAGTSRRRGTCRAAAAGRCTAPAPSAAPTSAAPSGSSPAST